MNTVFTCGSITAIMASIQFQARYAAIDMFSAIYINDAQGHRYSAIFKLQAS